MSEHVHIHAPEELGSSHGTTTDRERLLELVAAVLLSLATLGIAWSGYQAARWSGVQSREYALATSTRATENRLSTLAGQERIQDLLNFNRWLEVSSASTPEDQAIADLYVRRFRDEFVPAFRAWLAEDPLHNANAVATPLLMPQYQVADFVKADKLDEQADVHFEAGKASTEHADKYILVTVFLAAVLFFAGISLRFAWTAMRIAILGLGAASLGLAAVQLLSLPAH